MDRRRRIRLPHSRYALLGLYGALFLVLQSLLRCALLVESWSDIPHHGKDLVYVFAVGLVYDTAFLAYFLLPVALMFLALPNRIYTSRPGKVTAYAVLFVSTSFLYFLVPAEWIFWNEFHVRFNFIAVDYLIYTTEVLENIYESYPVVWIFAALFALAGLTLFVLRSRLAGILEVQEPFRRRAAVTAGHLGLCVSTYLFLGQSLRTSSSNNYLNELASNGAYQFVAAFKYNELDYSTFYRQGDDRELSPILKSLVGKPAAEGDLYDIRRHVDANSDDTRLNVMLITVESLSARYLGRFGAKGRTLTPFMDRWFTEGMLFTNFYATGTRTTRGLEAITLSLPPLPGRSFVKRPDNARIFNLGKVLADRGYDTVFLYGGRGFFDNMNAFYAGNGFRIVDQTTVPGGEIHFANAWGMADEDLFRATVREADADYRRGKPFFFQIMTTSNHRPYTYPEGRIDIPPGTGRAGALEYTDYAIGRLIGMAKRAPWFENTVFVLVADHCAHSAGKTGLPIRRYHIPLFIYCPGRVPAVEIDKIACQVDIAPTLLGLLGVRYDSWFFGRNILDEAFEERALIGNYQVLALYKDGRLAMLSPRQRIAVVDDPYERGTIRTGVATDPLVKETMAYYQGANYILKGRMNRY